MQITNALMTLALIAMGVNAAPAPLNINLGAYSPALVVGDGALTFSGGAEGGAGGGAGKGKGNGGAGKGNGGGAGKGKEGAAGGEGAAAAGAAAAGVPQTGIIAGRDNNKVEKRQLGGFDRALTFAEAALTKGPKVQLGNGEGGAGVGIIVDNNPTAAAQPNRAAE
ncbi:hypothetical protein CkaCkLH20_07150 [Colletotrichum karsti]|uniref:Uncharacterized protein n=1 Tax=Colletotrichum karsti TaxID=1095194 RepID=A0A9P6I3T9_9PEZI|nr:uncharacterized protein CkaCkLH20_07150 [Colletotrichum karsti]KAF9875330.1 hypothetical protein CkaCkLH20_07150 [Colletotrichum karsti]